MPVLEWRSLAGSACPGITHLRCRLGEESKRPHLGEEATPAEMDRFQGDHQSRPTQGWQGNPPSLKKHSMVLLGRKNDTESPEITTSRTCWIPICWCVRVGARVLVPCCMGGPAGAAQKGPGPYSLGD